MSLEPNRPAPRWLAVCCALLILMIGGGLRFAYCLTSPGHGDEQITTAVVRHLRATGDWDVNWAKADLPPDMHYNQYNFASYLYAAYVYDRALGWMPALAGRLAAVSDEAPYRVLAASLGVVVLLQTLRLGWRLGGAAAALPGAALAAVVLLLVQDAHYVRPETFCTVLTLGVVALAWPSTGGGGGNVGWLRWRIAGAAFLVGLLVACKVSMLLLAWLPLVPLLGRPGARGFVSGGLVAAAGLLAGFSVGAPPAVVHPQAFVEGIRHLGVQYAGMHPPHSHDPLAPTGDMMARYFAATLGWPALLAAALGLAALLRERRWREALLIAGPLVLFVGYFSTRTVFFERNVSHVVPLFCLLAGYGVAVATRPLLSWAAGPAMVAGSLLTAAVIVRPARISARFAAIELSWQGAQHAEAFTAAVRAAHPQAEFWNTHLLSDAPLDELATKLRAHAPVLLSVTDYRDDDTARHLALLTRRFAVTEVARDDGTFPELPTCTVLAYHNPPHRFLLVTGERAP